MLLSLFFFITLSCSQNDEIQVDNPETPSLNLLLLKVEHIAEQNNKVVTFAVALENGSFGLKEIELIESFKDSEFYAKNLNSFQNTNYKTYVITCHDSDGNVISTVTCPDAACASAAILACIDTDSGGCADICQIETKYIPSTLKK